MRGEQSTKAVRRQLGGRTTARLALMTVVVIAAVFLNARSESVLCQGSCYISSCLWSTLCVS